MTSRIDFGDYRSARERRDWAYAWLAANSLEGGEREAAIRDWWRCADLEDAGKLAVWSDPIGERGTGQDALWWMEEPRWQMTLGGVVIATHEVLDLNPLAVKWARVPAEAVAHLHREWALEHDPDNAGVTQEMFFAIDSGDRERIRAACVAIEGALEAAERKGQTWAWASAKSVWALGVATWEVGRESIVGWEARQAAHTASIATAWDKSRPTRTEWAHRWTAYVLQHFKETR